MTLSSQITHTERTIILLVYVKPCTQMSIGKSLWIGNGYGL